MRLADETARRRECRQVARALRGMEEENNSQKCLATKPFITATARAELFRRETGLRLMTPFSTIAPVSDLTASLFSLVSPLVRSSVRSFVRTPAGWLSIVAMTGPGGRRRRLEADQFCSQVRNTDNRTGDSRDFPPVDSRGRPERCRFRSEPFLSLDSTVSGKLTHNDHACKVQRHYYGLTLSLLFALAIPDEGRSSGEEGESGDKLAQCRERRCGLGRPAVNLNNQYSRQTRPRLTMATRNYTLFLNRFCLTTVRFDSN